MKLIGTNSIPAANICQPTFTVFEPDVALYFEYKDPAVQHREPNIIRSMDPSSTELPLSENAFAILKLICEEKTGTSRANILNSLVATGLEINKAEAVTSQLIYMLNNDGYLIEENSLYRFRSPLLRDFWFNRFSK